MATKPVSTLSIHPKTISNLRDKLYEKRKLGALEVGEIVKQLQASKDQAGVNNVIAYMVSTFANSSNPDSRKGGLIGLACIAIGLGGDVYTYLPLICPPVLRCFTDQDSRVRYYACESLYNVAKISREHILPFFNEIFDGLCKLAVDPDVNVKNGVLLLDRLMKDIITDSSVFEMEKFLPLLRNRIRVIDPLLRQFLIGWLNLLDGTLQQGIFREQGQEMLRPSV